MDERPFTAAVENARLVIFKFAMFQKVTIKPLGRITGEVLARCDRGTYREYRVVYWAESKRCDEWMLEDELEA